MVNISPWLRFFVSYGHIPLMRTMVLVYLPTSLGDFVRANVGKYSSTMIRKNGYEILENVDSLKMVNGIFPYKLSILGIPH